MKINIAYREDERNQAAAVIHALTSMFPEARVKRTDLKDEYRHAYLMIKPNNTSTAGNG